MNRLLLLALALLSLYAGGASATCTLVPLNLARDGNSQNTYVRAPSTCVDAMVLAANVAEVYTVQTSAQKCLFSSTAPFYARKDAAGAVPSTEVADGTASELSPAAWYVGSTTTIGFIAPTAAVITIACYN